MHNCLIFPTLGNPRIGLKNLKNVPNDTNDTTVQLATWRSGVRVVNTWRMWKDLKCYVGSWGG